MRARVPNYRSFVFIFLILAATSLLLDFLMQKPSEKLDKAIVRKGNNFSRQLRVPKTKSITISAVGDVMFDRQVKNAIIANGPQWPFSRVIRYLKADLAIANLESSITSVDKATAGKDVTFQGTPLGAQALKFAGINLVSLANNHALDYGLVSLRQTQNLLRKHNISYAGAGANKDEAYRPAILKVGDIKVGFLSFSDVIPFNSFPSAKLPGIAPARDSRKVASKIKALAGKVHIVLISFHWGVEYQDYPTAKQKELAKAAIDAGGDLVIGSHPHVTQGIAIYKKRLILYSLGNFVFDHYKARTGESFIFRVDMNYKGEFNFGRIWPILITSSGQPYIPSSNEGARILNRVKTISGKFGYLLVKDGQSFIINNQ